MLIPSCFCNIMPIPTIFGDELSYEERISKIVYTLNQVIEQMKALNISNQDFENRINAIIAEMKEYMEHYFDSEEVQEKINNKIDEMAQSGELNQIIEDANNLAYKVNAVDNDKFGDALNQSHLPYNYPNLINFGELNPAPIAKTNYDKGVDILAYFYNDFGLTATALSPNEGKGSYIWYDWQWNKNQSPYVYDPARQPSIGWYNGDASNVLDWITYWCIESGIKGYIFTQIISDIASWNDESSLDFWLYNLFNCKNFNFINYVLPIVYSNTVTAENYISIVNTIWSNYKNFYVFNCNGKNLITLFCWDMELLRGTFDGYSGPITNTMIYLEKYASLAKNLGYDGIMIMGRNYSGNFQNYAYGIVDLSKNDIIITACDYSEIRGGTFSNYQAYADGCEFRTQLRGIPNVVTAYKSTPPHPSNFNMPGSTPELFGKVLQKAIRWGIANKQPKIVTIYNVSEWAEAGPGLIPNIKDGFGYLDAVKNCFATVKENFYELTVPFSIPNDSYFWRKSFTHTMAGTHDTVEITGHPFNYNFNQSDYTFLLNVRGTSGGTVVFTQPQDLRVNWGESRMYVDVYVNQASVGKSVSISIDIIHN